MLTLSKIFVYSVGGGFTYIIVLMIISLLAVLNTLINSVQQRKRDIFVYASLGLSPFGAVLMFLIESLTYAVLASTIGYLIGYALNTILTLILGFEMFSYNVSSFFVSLSIISIMVTCMGASIYPSILASKMITPSLQRRWKPPTEPRGDQWEVPLPFRATTRDEAGGILVYLKEYFSELGAIRPAYRVLRVSDVDGKNLSFSLHVMLIPSELGISQKVTLQETVQKDGTFLFTMTIEREGGDYNQWRIRNYYFIDDVRKQILLWRSLSTDERKKYLARAVTLI